ncbi:MAG: nitrous oxide reductase accessory protein NosL, partial [Nitrospirae bacterium]|nr:nitrous oxide reductase accessory protein NosL [Nitrospirota bacterium]
MRKYYLVPCIMVIAFAAAIIASAEVNRKGPSSCEVCGMNTDSYPQSRMLLEYDDKTSASVCSIRCAAALMAAHREKAISAMSVADFHTRELIDAKKAFWVIGGKKPGAMTGVPKWAFLKKS